MHQKEGQISAQVPSTALTRAQLTTKLRHVDTPALKAPILFQGSLFNGIRKASSAMPGAWGAQRKCMWLADMTQDLQDSHVPLAWGLGRHTRASQRGPVPFCQHLNANTLARRQGPSRLHPRVLQDWEAHHTRISTHVAILSAPDSSLSPVLYPPT